MTLTQLEPDKHATTACGGPHWRIQDYQHDLLQSCKWSQGAIVPYRISWDLSLVSSFHICRKNLSKRLLPHVKYSYLRKTKFYRRLFRISADKMPISSFPAELCTQHHPEFAYDSAEDVPKCQTAPKILWGPHQRCNTARLMPQRLSASSWTKRASERRLEAYLSGMQTFCYFLHILRICKEI